MMSYNIYYPTAYNPYQTSPYQQQYSSMMQPQMAQQPVQNIQNAQPSSPSSIIWVRNSQEAAMYPVAPNNAVALWDSGVPAIYLKQADASGKPAMTTYDLVERTETAQADDQTAGVDLSTFASKADVATIAGIVSGMSKDIDAIKEEMGNLASQAVKRAVGAKTKKEPVQEDDD